MCVGVRGGGGACAYVWYMNRRPNHQKIIRHVATFVHFCSMFNDKIILLGVEWVGGGCKCHSNMDVYRNFRNGFLDHSEEIMELRKFVRRIISTSECPLNRTFALVFKVT